MYNNSDCKFVHAVFQLIILKCIITSIVYLYLYILAIKYGTKLQTFGKLKPLSLNRFNVFSFCDENILRPIYQTTNRRKLRKTSFKIVYYHHSPYQTSLCFRSQSKTPHRWHALSLAFKTATNVKASKKFIYSGVHHKCYEDANTHEYFSLPRIRSVYSLIIQGIDV